MRLFEEVDDFPDHVRISRIDLHRLRFALHVHEDEGRFLGRRKRKHSGVVAGGGNVVDHRRSGVEGGSGDFGTSRID